MSAARLRKVALASFCDCGKRPAVLVCPGKVTFGGRKGTISRGSLSISRYLSFLFSFYFTFFFFLLFFSLFFAPFLLSFLLEFVDNL